MIAIGYNVLDYTIPDGMDVVRFRQQLARAILRILAILGLGSLLMVAVTSCAPLEQRAAIPSARNRDLKGRYTLPVCPRCGAVPIDQWTGYHCLKGHVYETPNMKLKL